MRPRVALLAALLGGCGGGGAAILDGGDDAVVDGGESAAGLTLRELAPTNGPLGTYVELRGSGFDPAGGDGAVLWNDEVATSRAVARGKCAGDKPHCVAWYEWTAEKIVVALPVTAVSGRFAVRVAGVTTGAVPFAVTQRALPVGDKAMTVATTLSDGTALVIAGIDGGKLAVRVVPADGAPPRAKTVPVGDGISSTPLLRVGPTGFEAFVAGEVGPDLHLFHGPVEGPLVDTGVAVGGQQVQLFAATLRAGEPAAWVQAPDHGARLAWREGGVWKSADSVAKSFDFRMGSSVAVDSVEVGGAVHVAVGVNHGSFNPKYDLGYCYLAESGGVVDARSEGVKVDGDDYVRQPTIRVGADGVPEIFHIENVSLSTNIPVVRRRNTDGTWSRTDGTRIPFAARGSEAGFLYVYDPYDKGPYGSTHRLLLEAPGQMPLPISGDLQPVFHDPIAILWPAGSGLPTFIARDRDPNLLSVESGEQSWFVPAAP